jgi:hypothetical protein
VSCGEGISVCVGRRGLDLEAFAPERRRCRSFRAGIAWRLVCSAGWRMPHGSYRLLSHRQIRTMTHEIVMTTERTSVTAAQDVPKLFW